MARDDDGYAAIGDYAVLGDGRSVALVAGDGSIDWWAVPVLDAQPAFAALLDPAAGGSLCLAPADGTVEHRRYLPGTNVLETVWRTESGRVRITDSLNTGVAGRLPWTELGRRIDGLEGDVDLEFRVRPGTALGAVSPWAEITHRGPVLHVGTTTLAVRVDPSVEVRADDTGVRGRLTVSAGARTLLAVVAASDQPLYLPDLAAIDARIDTTIDGWRRWSDLLDWDGPDRDRILRNALALKLLVQASSGSIAAAGTTSLPERIGGPKNWDYRFCWVRDASLTVDALMQCGFQEEVHAAVAWLLGAIRRDGPQLHVMYTLDGAVPETAHHARVPGYRGSRPVQVGNDASGQLQLGIYGDLFGTVQAWIDNGHVLDVDSARQLADLADRCCDMWFHPDAGIWELHENRHYTISKIGCWRALQRAANLADRGHLAGPDHRWRHEAGRIRHWIDQNCWSPERSAYTFYAGTDQLDASVLLGARFGYDSGPRMSTTVDAVRAELGRGPLMYRYSGVEPEEGCFIACSYWAVEALAATGRRAEAQSLMGQLDTVFARTSPLGLLGEMADPVTGEMIGNLPQALSHLALINAATVLRDTVPGGSNSAGSDLGGAS